MNKNNIIVFDFETGGVDTKTTEPIEIAAIAIDPRSLDPISKYYSMCKPTDFSIVEDGALRVNGKTIAELEKAPEQSVVWPNFIGWIKQFNKGKGIYTAPIPSGKNIRSFDIPIFQRLCKKYGFTDKNGVQNVFNQRTQYDIEDFINYWFENNDELENQKMDTIREYFGMSKDGAHSAMIDTVQTAHFLIKFLQLHRTAFTRVKFRDSMRNLPDNLKVLLS